jgi:predicted TIM-barrel fold metal-dependent hydrolase
MAIIDGHAHACGDYLTADNIIRILDENNVDKVVLVPGELNSTKTYNLVNLAKVFPNRDVISLTNMLTKIVIPLTGAAKHIDEGNKYVYSLVQKYPDRIIQFYWAALLVPDIETMLDTRFKEWNFRGIKFHQCWESFKVHSEPFNKVAAWAARNDLPIFFHVGTKKEVKKLINYMGDHPDTTFIIGHLFGLEQYMKSGLEFKNVYFEISAPPIISLNRLMKAIDFFGAHKTVLGSDTPYGRNNLKVNIHRVNRLPIPEEEKQLILGINMQRLLRLND